MLKSWYKKVANRFHHMTFVLHFTDDELLQIPNIVYSKI